MKEQNYKNHSRLSLSYHGITGLALLILLIGAIRNVINADDDSMYVLRHDEASGNWDIAAYRRDA